MKKILLVCSAGMSTSMLVKKMKDYAELKDIEVEIQALPLSEGHQVANDWDVVLLGPQVGFDLGNFQKITTKPVCVIPQQVYALGKGKEALELALNLLK